MRWLLNLDRLLFGSLYGPPDTCRHCWHDRQRSDCRMPPYNRATCCCKCGQEVTRAWDDRLRGERDFGG